MLSSAVLQINTPSGQVTRADEEDQSNKNEKIDNFQSKARKQGKTNNPYAHNWCHGYILLHYEFTWRLEAPIVDKSDSLTTLFKKFFTDNILEQVFSESIKYVKLKGSHNSVINMGTPKAVIDDLQEAPCFGKILQMSQVSLYHHSCQLADLIK